MAKFKPVRFIHTSNWILGGIDIGVTLADEAYNQDIHKKNWHCGNCSKSFSTANNQPIPLGCIKCGQGIDWEGIFTEKAKVCPKCNTPFHKDSMFCSFHPGILLEEKEYWKTDNR